MGIFHSKGNSCGIIMKMYRSDGVVIGIEMARKLIISKEAAVLKAHFGGGQLVIH